MQERAARKQKGEERKQQQYVRKYEDLLRSSRLRKIIKPAATWAEVPPACSLRHESMDAWMDGC